jgi:hypothetical protein
MSKLVTGQFREAAGQLLKNWSSIDSNKPNRPDVHKLKCQKRDLLVRCYLGMDRADIAAYLKTAPLVYIDNLAVHKYLPLDKIFPTYDEYMKTKWTAAGNSSRPDGGYYIWLCGPSLCVYPDSPFFPKFYALLGPMSGHIEAKVPPLPGILVDDFLYARGF